MFKKIIVIVSSALGLATVGYITMAFAVVIKSDPATVLTLASSDRLPLFARNFAEWRVKSWDGCPTVSRDRNALGQTLRGYGVDGFDKKRVLETASHLLELGCDPNDRSLIGQTAMHEAVLYNEPDVVSFLLRNGADPAITIELADETRAESMRHYAGLNARSFAMALDSKSGGVDGRGEIIKLLSRTRS